MKKEKNSIFVKYTLSKETIKAHFKNPKKSASKIEKALNAFDSLYKSLDELLQQYDQNYLTDSDGNGGIRLNNDQITITLWCAYLELQDVFSDFDLSNNTGRIEDLLRMQQIVKDGGTFDDDFFVDILTAILMCIGSKGDNMSFLIAPRFSIFDLCPPNEEDYPQNKEDYTYKAVSYTSTFLSEDNIRLLYDCFFQCSLYDCSQFNAYISQVKEEKKKQPNTSKKPKTIDFITVDKENHRVIIPADVTSIDKPAHEYLSKSIENAKCVSVYGIDLLFPDLWNNRNYAYYQEEYEDKYNSYYMDLEDKYGDYLRDDLCEEHDLYNHDDPDSIDLSDEQEDLLCSLVENTLNREVSQIFIADFIDNLIHLINKEFDQCVLSDSACKDLRYIGIGMPEKYAYDILKVMKNMYPDDNSISLFSDKIETILKNNNKEKELLKQKKIEKQSRKHKKESEKKEKLSKNIRKLFQDKCKIIKELPDFKRKNFLFIYESGYHWSAMNEFMRQKGSALFTRLVSAHIDYIIVDTDVHDYRRAEDFQEKCIEAIKYIERQEEMGHTIEVIFFDDFKKQSNREFAVYVEQTYVEYDDRLFLVFSKKTGDIAEGAIRPDATVYGFSNSTAEKYALTHGITFHCIDQAEYDKDMLPENIKIEHDKIYTKGRVRLRIYGLTDKQIKELKVGEKIELVPEPDEMNDLRVVFRSLETGETRGIMGAGYIASYLMQKGYMHFTDMVICENGFAKGTVLWEEPFTEQTKLQLRYYQGVQKLIGKPKKILSELSPFASAALSVADMDYELGQSDMTNDFEDLFEPGNRLSFELSSKLSWSINTREQPVLLSFFRYSGNDCYSFSCSEYHLYIDKETKKLSCFLQPWQKKEQRIELSSAEEEFARTYINHYRKIHNLPPLFMTGGEQNGAI